MIFTIISAIVFSIISGFTLLVFGFGTLLFINSGVALLLLGFIIMRNHTHTMRNSKKQFMFSFIELFILNYEVQSTVDGVLTMLYPLLDTKAQKLFAKVRKNHDGMTLLEALRPYFSHHYYESFLDIVNVVTNRGGAIMQVSEVLLYSLSQSEARMLKLKRIDITYLVKFIFSWIFVMLVAIVFRFSLGSLISFTNLPLVYILGNEAFVALLLISFVLVNENTIRSGKRDY